MSATLATTPVRFMPEMEVPEANEAATLVGLDEELGTISQTTFKDTGHGFRGVHAKGHGLLRGELVVLDNLAPHLAQGLFAHPARYPVAMRFSTIPGDVLDDSVSTPRGLAVKVMGVEGERLPGSAGDTTQDFVMVNGPAFGAPTTAKFLESLKLLTPTTDKAPGLKTFASALARGTETVIEAFGGKSGTLIGLGGHPETHILGETFYSQAPILYGDYIAKFCLAPTGDLAALKDVAIDAGDDPDALRDAVAVYFATQGGTWELRVQLCTDLATMPIEDSSVEWSQAASPYVVVAFLTVDAQASWSDANVKSIEEGMAFSPWHGIAAHRPLGSVMRARKAAYAHSAELRGERNGAPIHEPKG
jgi:hypothetical protein